MLITLLQKNKLYVILQMSRVLSDDVVSCRVELYSAAHHFILMRQYLLSSLHFWS